MHRFIEIIKAHPMAILGGVLIGAVLIYMLSKGGGATVAPTYVGNDQNNALINAQLVASQDQTRVAGNIAAMEYASTDHTTDAALAAYQIAADAHAGDNANAVALQANNNSTLLAQQAASNAILTDANEKSYQIAIDANAKTYDLSKTAQSNQSTLATLQATIGQQEHTADINSAANLALIKKSQHNVASQNAMFTAIYAPAGVRYGGF